MEEINEEEILFLLDFIPRKKNLPSKIEEYQYNLNYNKFYFKLKGKKIYKILLPKLKEELMKQFYNSLISAGEPVGIISAQTLGEKLTQTKLNMFHLSGVNSSTGMGRINELLNATKEPSSINHTFYIDSKYDIKYIMKELNCVEISSKDLKYIGTIKNIQLISIFEKYYNIQIICKDWLEIQINPNILWLYKIDINDFASKIENITQYKTLSSPPHLGFFLIKCNNQLKLNQLFKKEIFYGISGINETIITQEKNNWKVNTICNKPNGKKSYLMLLKLLSIPLIDKYTILSSNLWDIYNIYGIEATKNFLFKQFSEQTEGIQKSHIELLVNQMVHKGYAAPISRYDLRNEDVGPLTKISFEEILSNIIKESLNESIDNIQTNNARIICGQMPKLGTGVVELLYNN